MSAILKAAATALCCGGFFFAQAMFFKALRAAQGRLDEPSVVQQPAARLFLGLPNAFFGMLFYGFLAAAIWFATGALWYVLAAAAFAAAATSLYLAYNLVFVTRMWCPYCWASHAINWLLLSLVMLSR